MDRDIEVDDEQAVFKDDQVLRFDIEVGDVLLM